MTTAVVDKPKVNKKWRKLLGLLPGYDPFDQAGDCVFVSEIATEAMAFFPECLTHIKGPKAGQSFELEDWQKCIVANLFGWIRPDGTRRYRTAFIYVGRKNGKTPFAAGLVLYGLLCDGEGGAEVYSAAAEREQAKLVYGWVKGMVRLHEELAMRTRVYQNAVVEVDPETGIETGSFYKPISAEAHTKHGYNSHFIVVDELHAQPNSELVEVLETSTGARSQPLIIYITTADYMRESICNIKYDYACKVREGIIEDGAFLPAIYEADKDDDWTSADTWKKANPNLGVAVTPEYITAACRQAQDSPSFENTFKRLHLNMRTEQDVRWLSMVKWDACKRGVGLDDMELEQVPCYAAMDLATTTDIAAYIKLFVLDEGMYAVVAKFYVPEENAWKRQKRDRVPYIDWHKAGLITMTPGEVIDYSFIRKDLEDDWQRFNIQELAFDRWNFEALRQQFMAEGIPAEKMIAFGQGFVSLSAPTKELEKLVISGKLIHNNNAVLRWMASNVAIELDAAGNIKPSKRKSTEKIDGIVATIMALGRAISQPLDEGSVYEDRGLFIL